MIMSGSPSSLRWTRTYDRRSLLTAKIDAAVGPSEWDWDEDEHGSFEDWQQAENERRQVTWPSWNERSASASAETRTPRRASGC